MLDMIVKPTGGYDEEGFNGWYVERGSRQFIVLRTERGDWATYDPDRENANDTLDVSDDLSGALEFITGLFR